MGFEWLFIPILIITLQLPQGALVYWLMSSLCSVGQSLLFGNASVRRAFDLTQTDSGDYDAPSKFTPEVMDLFLDAAESWAKSSIRMP